jgi:hypothetical protein
MIECTVFTESGFWTPLVWAAAFLVILAMVYVLRSIGEKRHKPRTEQSLPFFSGNLPPGRSIKMGNLYWGFFRAMERNYAWLRRMHNGIVNDYVFSFVVLIITVLAALIMGGALL